jgi:hypothetical protein
MEKKVNPGGRFRIMFSKTMALVMLMGVPLARSIPSAPAVTTPAVVPRGAYHAGLACAPAATLRALRGGGIQSPKPQSPKPSPPAAPAKYVNVHVRLCAFLMRVRDMTLFAEGIAWL